MDEQKAKQFTKAYNIFRAIVFITFVAGGALALFLAMTA